MPRRLILSATERDTLLALPESQDDLIRYYTFNDSDLSLIRQRRGDVGCFHVERGAIRAEGAGRLAHAARNAARVACVRLTVVHRTRHRERPLEQ